MFLTFNEGTKPGMLSCTDTKIWFHKDNLVKNFPPKYQIYRSHTVLHIVAGPRT